jgi:hypothetical protein
MGTGEAASLAVAVNRGWAIASDEKKAFRREASARPGSGRILTTPGLYVVAVRAGVLSASPGLSNPTAGRIGNSLKEILNAPLCIYAACIYITDHIHFVKRRRLRHAVVLVYLLVTK